MKNGISMIKIAVERAKWQKIVIVGKIFRILAKVGDLLI